MSALLQTIKEICRHYQIKALEAPLDIAERLASGARIMDVAVIGQFKAGKSSFLNSFLGRELLPTGVIPLTSVITRIAYGERERAVATYSDGRAEEIPLAGLRDYVTETGNPDNRKNVLRVDLELPELDRFRGLRFVDTPGLGSLFRHTSEVTGQWAPELDVALVAVSADRPLSESEIQLIREAYKYSPRIVILLTKADLFEERQLREITDYVIRALEKDLGRSVPVYCYSIRSQTGLYRDRLTRDLFAPLMGDFDLELDRIVRHKIQALAASCRNYLELSLEISKKSDQERENLRGLIVSERLSVDYVRSELLLVTTSFWNRTWDAVYDRIRAHRAGLSASLTEAFRREFAAWTGNLYRLSRRYETWLEESLRVEIDRIVDREHSHFTGLLENARKHFALFCRSFRDRLNHRILATLGVEIKSEEWVSEIRELRRPDVRVSRASDFHLDMLWFLFPMAIFRGVFKASFAKQIPDEVDKNLYRVTADLTSLINKGIEELKDQTYHFITNELSTIEALLTRDSSRTRDIQAALDRIQRDESADEGEPRSETTGACGPMA